MEKPRILYITEEICPYLPETPNSRLGRDLPTYSQGRGCEVRVFMPRFGSINERRNQLHEVIRLSGVNIPIADADHPLIIKVASMQPSRIQVYFVDNDDYFQRLKSDANPIGKNRADNDERAIFFTRGTIETVKKLRWEPDAVHCVGWMAALSTMFLHKVYKAEPGLQRPTIIYTALPFQEPTKPLDPQIVNKLREEGFSDEELKELIEGPTDPRALQRLAMRYADAVAIVDIEADDLKEYAAQLGKPTLILGEEYSAADYDNFYISVEGK